MINLLIPSHRQEPNRRIGRSTCIALRAIADAISKPGTPVLLQDHWGTANADEHLMYLTRRIIAKLDLQHIGVVRKSVADGRRYEFYLCSNHVVPSSDVPKISTLVDNFGNSGNWDAARRSNGELRIDMEGPNSER